MAKPTHCIDCGYSLEGLPDDHRCPEYGMPYDPSMVVIEEARGQIIAGVVLGVMAIIAFVGPLVGGVPLRKAHLPWLAIPFLYGALRYWKGQRNRAIVLRTGVGFVFRGDVPGKYFTWEEIGAVRLEHNWKTHIDPPNGKPVCTLPLDFFG